MARVTIDGRQRQSPPEAEETHDERAEIEEAKKPPAIVPGAEQTLNVGHASVRAECWACTSVMAWSNRCGELTVTRGAALRLRRAARQRTPSHRLRPAQRAEARLTSQDPEYTD
jgi:hypothetical protein